MNKVTAIHIVKDDIVIAQIILPGHINPLILNTSDGYESQVWPMIQQNVKEN